MNKTMPQGISVIYFDDKSKNIYAELQPDKEQAKKLSKRIYKNAMTAIYSKQNDTIILRHTVIETIDTKRIL